MMPTQRKAALPDLHALHQRHPGLYRPLSEAYADAAALCFSETQKPPIDLEIHYSRSTSLREVSWREPTGEARASWANPDDATRDGAYCVGLATVEAELGYVGLARADRRTGADFYVGLPGGDLEETLRLEVSGVRTGDLAAVQGRLRDKTEQARRGRSDRPAMACVVGFAARVVAVTSVETEEDAES